MKRRDFLKASGAIGASAIITPFGIVQQRRIAQQISSLQQDFITPPASAKPHTWWHWMNGNITKEGITLDLEAMARVGIGGFQNFDAGTGIPKGPIVYLSPEWLELKKHAIAEAQRLGLEFTMHNCPGWSSSGGPWITPELAMQQVTTTEITVEGNKVIEVVLPKPESKLDYYKDICVLAFPNLSNEKVDGWEKRANFEFNRYQVDDIPKDVPAIPLIDIVDVSQYMEADGHFVWGAQRGQWTIVRFGYTPIGTQNRSAPDTGVGLECDKYSASAFEFHFNKMMENLLPFLEPLGKQGKAGLLIDSYEVGMQNWTPGFEKIFKERNGYDMIHYMAAITGRVVENADTTNRFLWDLRRTQGTLMTENYYGKFTELCHKHNIISYIQPYDRGPMEEMQIGSRIDINVAEFWNNLSSIFQNNKTMRRTVKLSAAIAHTNGQKIVAAESFTSEPESGKWQEHPFFLKVQGDRMFTQGLNRMVFHRFAHQPHPTARPGMTMGPWGSHFDRTNTWWEQGAAWMTYLSRCQYMLQQGVFVADIVYFTGEDAGVYTRVERDELYPVPSEGLDYDLVNSEVLLTKAKVVEKQLVLESGTSYKVLSIQDFKTISVKVLSKIIEFQRQGLTIIGKRPLRTPGLSNDKDEFENLIKQLALSTVDLSSVKKDFEYSSESGDAPITYIHRRTPEADIYFIANQRRSYESLVCSFRVSNKQPEIWDPVTGHVIDSRIYDVPDDTVVIPITLNESGSAFIVFRNKSDNNPIVEIRRDTKTVLQANHFKRAYHEPVAEQNTFDRYFSVKPENNIMLSTKNFMDGQLPWTDYYCVYPSPGEKIHGKGHSTLGLAVGRNGVAVWENSTGVPEFNFSLEAPISGFAQIRLECREGVPSITIGDSMDKISGTGVKSKYIVHPPTRYSFLNEGASYFNGDMELQYETQWPGFIDDGDRLLLCGKGNFDIVHKDGKTSKAKVSHVSVDLSKGWEITFPEGSGAPASIQLDGLISLTEHERKGVKYFSGTCVYKKSFDARKKKSRDKRYFLDLGRVEVIAEVILNGRSLGTLWTRPFSVDITDALVNGNNRLEVRVTNPWVNRLIGDEQEPEVDKYSEPAGPINSFSALSVGAILELPEWYKHNDPKPNDGRVAFATWKHYNKQSPLLLSGMLGPVVLTEVTAVRL